MTETTAGYDQAVRQFTVGADAASSLITLVPWTGSTHYRDEALTMDLVFDKTIDTTYVDPEVWQVLRDAKREFSKPGFQSARDHVYAFSGVNSGIFSSRAAYHLASLDYALDVTGSWSSLIPYDDKNYGVVDLAAAPGSWTEYVYYRHSRATGVGISLISDDPMVPKWSEKLAVSAGTYTIYTGGEGDLYSQWKKFQAPLSDLVLYDGGFQENTEEELERQEASHARLWTAAVSIALRTSKPGAHCVMKCFDLVSTYSAQLLYLISWAWSEVVLYKPATMRPLNAEVLVVAKGFRGSEKARELVDAVMRISEMSRGLFPVRIFREALPDDFTQWLTARNDALSLGQAEAASVVISYMEGQGVELPKIDLVKVFIAWSIPGSVPKGRDTVIRRERAKVPMLKEGRGRGRVGREGEARGVQVKIDK